MREVTLTDVERLQSQAVDADVAFEMDEEAFRAFYDRTARLLWAYLSRITRQRRHPPTTCSRKRITASCARGSPHESDAHRRHYLFRIATNLVHDRHRASRDVTRAGRRRTCAELPAPGDDGGVEPQQRTDLRRAMARLKPRERGCCGWPTCTAPRTGRSATRSG